MTQSKDCINGWILEIGLGEYIQRIVTTGSIYLNNYKKYTLSKIDFFQLYIVKKSPKRGLEYIQVLEASLNLF